MDIRKQQRPPPLRFFVRFASLILLSLIPFHIDAAQAPAFGANIDNVLVVADKPAARIPAIGRTQVSRSE
jgi:hypothetical protein